MRILGDIAGTIFGCVVAIVFLPLPLAIAIGLVGICVLLRSLAEGCEKKG